MNKAQILIMIALIALVIWYLSQETKPAQSLIASRKKSILPTSLPKYPSPSPHASPAIELTDYGWLTDDNLEFILKNHAGIQAALAQQKQFHLRTDIANVYNAFHKAKTNQAWDLDDFCQELAQNRAQYTLLPLRVNGNHWGLVILADLTWGETEANYAVYYTSSGGISLEEEKEQLKAFIVAFCLGFSFGMLILFFNLFLK